MSTQIDTAQADCPVAGRADRAMLGAGMGVPPEVSMAVALIGIVFLAMAVGFGILVVRQQRQIACNRRLRKGGPAQPRRSRIKEPQTPYVFQKRSEHLTYRP